MYIPTRVYCCYSDIKYHLHSLGFGFVLVGGDSPGELLVIKDIMINSAAEKDGVLMKGDVLVRVNDKVILMCPHQEVVQLIKSVHIGATVEIEVCCCLYS